jgi:sterol desaturase/sphingolipid hydroxylase (fatty acid hydroxylase superfamily)
MYLLTICSTISFWFIAFLFYAFDCILFLKWPDLFQKYRTQPLVRMTYADLQNAYKKAFSVVSIDYLIRIILMITFENMHTPKDYPLVLINLLRVTIDQPPIYTIPTEYIVFINIVIILIIAWAIEIILTIEHVFLHNYAYWIHKTHHAFTAPISLTVNYNHPLETIFGFSLILGIFYLSGARIETLCIITFLSNLVSIHDHSGYCFFSRASYHDKHHEKFTVNLASPGLFQNISNKIIQMKAKRVD